MNLIWQKACPKLFIPEKSLVILHKILQTTPVIKGSIRVLHQKLVFKEISNPMIFSLLFIVPVSYSLASPHPLTGTSALSNSADGLYCCGHVAGKPESFASGSAVCFSRCPALLS